MTVALRAEEVQRLALSGYDLQCSLHLVLGVEDAAKARELLADLLQRDVLTFGDSSHVDRAVNIGFTCRGLEVLGLDGRYKAELEKKAPAFCEGAPARAARRLGDAGPSAAERWEPAFSPGRAHVLISIHGGSEDEVRSIANELGSMDGAREAFAGWLENRFLAKHLTLDPKHRTVHFGFRDLIAKPKIAEPWIEGKHHAGELVLGYPNDAGGGVLPERELRCAAQGRAGREALQRVRGSQGPRAWGDAGVHKGETLRPVAQRHARQAGRGLAA
jgi:hypothetical protein